MNRMRAVGAISADCIHHGAVREHAEDGEVLGFEYDPNRKLV